MKLPYIKEINQKPIIMKPEIKKNTIEIDFPELEEYGKKLDKILEHFTYLLKEDITGKTLLKTKDVMKLLGISEKTLQNYRNQGKISFTKVGNIIYYKQCDIDKFIETNKRYRICG